MGPAVYDHNIYYGHTAGPICSNPVQSLPCPEGSYLMLTSPEDKCCNTLNFVQGVNASCHVLAKMCNTFPGVHHVSNLKILMCF